jgi:octaprenyl-diphosphate synthase
VDIFNKIKEYVGGSLNDVNEIILQCAKSETDLIPVVTEYLVSAGGKRIRPLLTLMFGQHFAADMSKCAKLAAAVETIHTATLLHDDVIDESPTRRGKSTVNSLWGNKQAILVGDFLLAEAFCLMVEVGSLSALDMLSQASKTITESEVWQLDLLFQADLLKENYLKLIEGKTAVLFAAATAVVPLIMN